MKHQRKEKFITKWAAYMQKESNFKICWKYKLNKQKKKVIVSVSIAQDSEEMSELVKRKCYPGHTKKKWNLNLMIIQKHYI